MNCYSAKNMANAFRTVRQNTLQIANEIPEDKYDFAAVDGGMTVAALLAHIASGTYLARQLHGVEKKTSVTMEDFGAWVGEATRIQAALTTKAAIIDALTTRGEEFAGWLETVSDAQFAELVQFPAGLEPPQKTRFEMLLGVKEHEMHHRGQLMVLQRMLGITPHLTRRRQERMAASKG